MWTWFEAAQFINWLNIEQGFSPAYKFNEGPLDSRGNPTPMEFALWVPDDAGFNPDNPFRNQAANYVLPSVDEWYKAAYFDPTTREYFEFAMETNAQPLRVASGTDSGTAVLWASN